VVLANPIARDYLELLTEFETERPLVHLGDRSVETLMRPPQPGTLFHEIKFGSTSQRLFEVTPHALETGPQAGGGLLVLREVTQERQQILYRQTQERLASVGQLAAGIAHDFNNIMGVIVLYSQLVQKNAELSSKNRGYMNTIHHQAQHAARLTEQILDFSRRSVMERRPMNMVHFMKELMQLWRRTLPENIDFSLAHSAREHNINADPTRLQQVMMNLAVNARHAMPNGGVFRIVLEDVALKPEQATPLPDMSAGDWLKITVSDTGEGVHPEALPHVFEPFFTTKTPDKGTGLGLAQVYGIVKQHDGYIDVTSQVGTGTTFIIYLPSLAINDDAPQELEPRITAKGNQETILIVEDASAMREALCDTLEALNYTTLVAPNGKDALALFKQHADSIALVLSDVVMPEMDGLVLAGKLKELKPDVKIVMMSGYPLQNDGPGLLRQEITAWVQKPFDDKRIAEVLKKTLTP
jgi:signal transduction histidine kinase/CheY-like chemotaxis protein